MVITILEARLPKEKWTVLEQAYENAIQQLDKGIVNTFLAQDAKEPDLWRIVTVWSSREALIQLRNSGVAPRGILIFQAAGAQPVSTVFNVVSSA